MTTNIIITGIGGQGIIFVADKLRRALIEAGFQIAGYDHRGGAQRLGHVAAIIRAFPPGTENLAPEIPIEGCDILISLEASEGLRFSQVIGRQTEVTCCPRLVIPTNQRRTGGSYPSLEECRTFYRKQARCLIEHEFEKLAMDKFGKAIYANMIALGTAMANHSMEDVALAVAAELPSLARRALEFGLTLHQMEDSV